MTASWRRLWVETTAQLGGTPEAANEARWMGQEASGRTGVEWATGSTTSPPSTPWAASKPWWSAAAGASRCSTCSVRGAFRRLDLMVDRRVLIPRPETEQVVEVALELARGMPRPLVVADLGTGSGAIALALADELPLAGVEIWATDRSLDALDVARANLAGLGRPAVNVRLAGGDWFDALPVELAGRLDLVVSNPPYVATDDPLDDAVRAWEPAEALVAGVDGLDAVRAIVAGAPRWLRPGGALVMEIGVDQARAAAAEASAAGLVDVAVRPDLTGRDRILIASAIGQVC